MSTFTQIHVLLSFAGIVAGFIVVFGLLNSNRMDGWTWFFLATTAATSATGFFLPAPHFLPSHAIGILSLAALAIAILARYVRNLAGGWRRAYVITAVLALYFNTFVLTVQLFQKVPALHDLAPTQSEPPFLVTEVVLLGLFVWLGIRAVSKFHEPTPARTFAARSGS